MRQRRALDVNAVPGQYLHQPIERQMNGMLGHLGRQIRSFAPSAPFGPEPARKRWQALALCLESSTGDQ